MKIKSFLNRLLLLIIIIILGFVFWLGWEQLELSENTYGIVFTKTSGWHDKLINSKGFNWSIEKVIPNNYKIHKFKIEKLRIDFDEDSYLPSSELYASFNNINYNNFKFSYNLTGTVEFNPSYLLSMINSGTFTEDSFIEWQDNKIKDIKNLLESFINEKIIYDEILTINSSAHEFISEKFTYLKVGDIYINLNKPDVVLYNLSRDKYIQNMEAQAIADEKYLIKSLEQKNNESLRLDLLKKYGEVFTQYPIMIEYLKIDQGILLDRATMEDFISLPNQN